MTKHEKLEKAKTNHKYAIERIAELEKELTKQRRIATERMTLLRRYAPHVYGENPKPLDFADGGRYQRGL